MLWPIYTSPCNPQALKSFEKIETLIILRAPPYSRAQLVRLGLEGGKQASLGFPILSRAWFSIIFIPLFFLSPLLLYASYNCYDNISIHLIHVLCYNFHRLLWLYAQYSQFIIISIHKFIIIASYNCVSLVLIHCLPMNTPYILGYVIDRGCDTPVESFVVHSLNIGARRVRLRRKNKLCY